MAATKRHTQMQCRTSTSEFPRPAVLGWYCSGVRREIRDLAKSLPKLMMQRHTACIKICMYCMYCMYVFDNQTEHLSPWLFKKQNLDPSCEVALAPMGRKIPTELPPSYGHFFRHCNSHHWMFHVTCVFFWGRKSASPSLGQRLRLDRGANRVPRAEQTSFRWVWW